MRGPLLLSGFGVRVPAGAPPLTSGFAHAGGAASSFARRDPSGAAEAFSSGAHELGSSVWTAPDPASRVAQPTRCPDVWPGGRSWAAALRRLPP